MEAEMTEDRKRIWKFLAENVILGENTKLNRHQIFLKDKFTLNQKQRQEKRMAEQAAAKEAYKLQLK